VVALAGFRDVVRLPATVLIQRASDVVGFIEATLFVTPNEPLVALVGLDEFPLAI
jgi:hypothetical protein